MQLPRRIKIKEVCPRDGLQNISVFIETDQKIRLVKAIIDAGADEVEVTSFVHPKYVPQFKDASEVFQGVKDHARLAGTKLIALVPNKKGALNAKEAGLETINCVISASEIHNKRNVNRSVAESLSDLRQIVEEIEGVEVHLALACAFGSPFGDDISLNQVETICEQGFAMGIRMIGLADSAGVSTPLHTRLILQGLKKHFDIDRLSVHLHDTRGMGIANAYVALEEGITNFDASLGGLGGCPFIPGAKGNIATEDFVNMASQMGIAAGYRFERLLSIAKSLPDLTRQPVTSCMATCQPCSKNV